MASVFRQSYTKTLPDGSRVSKFTKKWYAEYIDANGVRRRVPGYVDRAATQQLAARLERDAAREAEGLTDPTKPHRLRPLLDHLIDYGAVLDAKGDTVEHVRGTLAQVRAILNGCGFIRLDDVDAGKAATWLHDLRRDAKAVQLPADQESFTPAEVAALLTISGAAVRSAVKRLGLEATGQGRARRISRAAVESLCDRARKGNGPQTVNHYVRAIRGFFRWLVKAKRATSNPLDSLSLLNTCTDVRRGRRELTVEELRMLLDATLKSGWAFRGLTGRDRFHLYLTASTTGFRARALAHLTPGDFDLNETGPTVTLPARYNKSRKPKIQPIPTATASQLRQFLEGKPTSRVIWGGTWARDHRGAEMIRGDLDAAGIPYAVEGPDGPEYADFHALRHTFLTMLGRHGVDLRTAQELAGHSKPELTARYSHRRLHDLAGAVEKLPCLTPSTFGGGGGCDGGDVSSRNQNSLRATGTHGCSLPQSYRTFAELSVGSVTVGIRQALHGRLPWFSS